MKKTIIALVALSGLASAETYNFVGSDNSWTEVASNWKSDAGTSPNDSGWTNTGSGNKFVIGKGKIAKSGGNMTFANTTLEIQDGGTLYTPDPTKFNSTTLEIQKGGTMTIGSEALFNNSTINIADGSAFSTMTSGGGIKLKNTTINTNSTVTLHRLTFNADSNMGNITLNLKETGKISVTNTYVNSDYTGSITLSAVFQDGYLTGCGDIILKERTLVDFGNNAGGYGSAELSTLLSRVKGGTLTLKNGDALTLGTFDSSDLTAGDVGTYKLVMDGSAVKVQYVAYSQSIPEPTTATLSLLALAGLAARRRRR